MESLEDLSNDIRKLTLKSNPSALLHTIQLSKDSRDLNLLDCISKFMKVEVLDDDNKVSCDQCFEETYARNPLKIQDHQYPLIYNRAYKRYLYETIPPVLILHLKRFQQVAGLFG
jgi:ubiquitin C-terminal hydrolase